MPSTAPSLLSQRKASNTWYCMSCRKKLMWKLKYFFLHYVFLFWTPSVGFGDICPGDIDGIGRAFIVLLSFSGLGLFCGPIMDLAASWKDTLADKMGLLLFCVLKTKWTKRIRCRPPCQSPRQESQVRPEQHCKCSFPSRPFSLTVTPWKGVLPC